MNKRLFIGIDFSLNSTGLVFRFDGETKYVAVFNRYTISKSKTKTIGEIFAENDIINSIVKISNSSIKPIDIKPIPSVKKIGLCQWERLHIPACLARGRAVYEVMKEEIYSCDVKMDDVYICMENYSYGSNTDNLIQVVEATMKLKQMIFEDMMLCPSNFHIITGPTLKKWVGRGDYDKYQMLMAYVGNHREDKSLSEDSFYKAIKKNKKLYLQERIKKKNPYIEVKAPISDLIDAYFCCLWLENEMKSIGI